MWHLFGHIPAAHLAPPSCILIGILATK